MECRTRRYRGGSNIEAFMQGSAGVKSVVKVLSFVSYTLHLLILSPDLFCHPKISWIIHWRWKHGSLLTLLSFPFHSVPLYSGLEQTSNEGHRRFDGFANVLNPSNDISSPPLDFTPLTSWHHGYAFLLAAHGIFPLHSVLVSRPFTYRDRFRAAYRSGSIVQHLDVPLRQRFTLLVANAHLFQSFPRLTARHDVRQLSLAHSDFLCKATTP